MDEIIGARKRIGLVAHDSRKGDLAEWAVYNRRLLVAHDLVATATTGTLLEEELGVGITKLQSGPLGGDLQLGGLIADGSIDMLVFFWDPMTADFLISSPLMRSDYVRAMPNYQGNVDRLVPA